MKNFIYVPFTLAIYNKKSKNTRYFICLGFEIRQKVCKADVKTNYGIRTIDIGLANNIISITGVDCDLDTKAIKLTKVIF